MNIDSLLTKYNDELEIVGTMPKTLGGVAKRNTPITPKQNYINWIRGDKPLFLPMPSDCASFAPAIIPDVIARHYVIENQPQDDFPDDGKDMFGIDWVYEPTCGGSMVVPGNPSVRFVEDWQDAIELPDVASWDWDGSAKINENLKQDYIARKCWMFTGFFERLISWMDFENAAIALIDEDSQEDVHRALSAITDIYEEITRRVKHYYDMDIMYVHDDWGSQMAPFFSYETCHDMIIPHLKRLVDFTHSLGMPYDMHSCGNTGSVLLPLMVEAGVDSWRPQPMNDYGQLFDDHGHQIRLQVCIDPPHESLTDQEVAQMTEEFLDRYSDPSRNAWAAPFFREQPTTHARTYPIMYAVSREYYAAH